MRHFRLELLGREPEELQPEMPHLSPAQIRTALTYYQAHQAEVDAYIAQTKQWIDQMRAQEKDPLTRAELLSRLKDGRAA